MLLQFLQHVSDFLPAPIFAPLGYILSSPPSTTVLSLAILNPVFLSLRTPVSLPQYQVAVVSVVSSLRCRSLDVGPRVRHERHHGFSTAAVAPAEMRLCFLRLP